MMPYMTSRTTRCVAHNVVLSSERCFLRRFRYIFKCRPQSGAILKNILRWSVIAKCRQCIGCQAISGPGLRKSQILVEFEKSYQNVFVFVLEKNSLFLEKHFATKNSMIKYQSQNKAKCIS